MSKMSTTSLVTCMIGRNRHTYYLHFEYRKHDDNSDTQFHTNITVQTGCKRQHLLQVP